MDQARKHLKGKNYHVFDDIPKELYDSRKDQLKKFQEAKEKGFNAYFSKAQPDKLCSFFTSMTQIYNINYWASNLEFRRDETRYCKNRQKAKARRETVQHLLFYFVFNLLLFFSYLCICVLSVLHVFLCA